MRALLISHGFPPTQHSGVFRAAAFAKYLPEFGVTPIVLCGQAGSCSRVPEYGDADGAAFVEQMEVVRCDWGLGESVRRAPHYVRAMLRLPVLNSLARSRLFKLQLQHVIDAGSEIIGRQSPDIILATSPPVEALLVGSALSHRHGLPLVCDLRDPWTYFPWARYRHRLDFMLERRRERNLLNSAAKVIANTKTAARIMTELVKVERHRVVVLPNGYDGDEFRGPSSGPVRPGRFVITYSGILASPHEGERQWKHSLKKRLGFDFQPLEVDYTTRSPRYVLAAAERLLDLRPELRSIVLMLFVGRFNDADYRAFQQFRYSECLEVQPPVSSRKAIEICRGSQLLLLLQLSICRNGIEMCPCIPGKLYSYLRTGTPILAAVDSREIRETLGAAGRARVVLPRDVDGIRMAIEQEIDSWRSGAAAPQPDSQAIGSYDRRMLTARLAEVLKEAAAADGARASQTRHSLGELVATDRVTSVIKRVQEIV